MITMKLCLICKENVDQRYSVEVKNTDADVSISGFICRFCFNKFMESYYNKGFFKLGFMKAWAKDKKDAMRRF